MMKKFLSGVCSLPTPSAFILGQSFSTGTPFKSDLKAKLPAENLKNPQTFQMLDANTLRYVDFKINDEGLLQEIMEDEGLEEKKVIVLENNINKLLVYNMRGKRYEQAKRKRKKRKNGSNNSVRWK